jgi:hypothetical protein
MNQMEDGRTPTRAWRLITAAVVALRTRLMERVRGGGSDGWDGSGRGGVFDDATNDPGGTQAFVEANMTFIRLQDTGDVSGQA